MALSKFDLSKMKKNISLRNDSIILTLADSIDRRNFLIYIDEFCIENRISNKFVGESITIYPSDFNELNIKRIDTSDVYVSLIAWNESNSIDENDEFPIEDMYWVDVEEEINSFEDLEALLIKIRDTKQVPEAYYTEQECSDIEKEREQRIQKGIKQDEKRKGKFSKRLKKLGITESDFHKLTELYAESK